MRNTTAILAMICLSVAAFSGGEPVAPKPPTITLTFFVSGTECPSCVYLVGSSINAIKGVTDVDVRQGTESQALVTFDPKAASAHQIAQAVADSISLHGKSYEAMLRLRVPDYSKNGNAAKVDAVFARLKEWVTVETDDKSKGEFVLRFRPLKADPKAKKPQGWNLAQIETELRAPPPKGLGLDFEFEKGE